MGVFTYHVFSTLFERSPHGFEHAIANWTEPFHSFSQVVLLCLSEMHRLVIVFFLISGYFIHRTYLQWQARHPQERLLTFTRFFLWKRFWRLVPAFWVALLFSYFCTYKDPLAFSSFRKLAVNATLLKTLFPGYFFSVNYAHWYVAVQWQLDLLYPLFLYLVWRSSFKFAFIIACGLALFVGIVLPHFTSAAYLINLPFRWAAEWVLGAYVAVLHSQDRRMFSRPRIAALVCLLGLVISFKLHFGVGVWALSRLILALVLETVILSQSRLYRVERWLAPIGLYSYSLYLLHLPIIGMSLRGLNSRGLHIHSVLTVLEFMAISFALSLTAAFLSYRWVEEESSALGSRCWKFIYPLRSVRTGILAPPVARLNTSVHPTGPADGGVSVVP